MPPRAPVPQNSPVDSSLSFWLGRQPILHLTGSTVASELLFRSGASGGGNVTDNRMATASVIAHAFNELGIASVLGNCRGFIHFDAELLETVEITPEIVERCRDLRSRGFSFALDDVIQVDEAHAPILPLVDIVKVDLLGTTPDALPGLVAAAKAAGRVKLLAEKVDSHEQAELCRRLGFDLFQGYFFARPVVLEGRRADPARPGTCWSTCCSSPSWTRRTRRSRPPSSRRPSSATSSCGW